MKEKFSPTSSADIPIMAFEPRITRLETEMEALAGAVRSLAETVREQGARQTHDVGRLSTELNSQLRGLQAAFESGRRPNWQLLLSAASAILVFVVGLNQITLSPVTATQTHLASDVARSVEWQDDYMRGKIPAASQGLIAELTATVRERFGEVETQFRAFKERMLENENFMRADSERQEAMIQEFHRNQAHLRERMARVEEHDRLAPPSGGP